MKGLDVQDQVAVDNFMIKELDGTDNKGKLVTVLPLQHGDRLDVCRPQILTTRVNPRNCESKNISIGRKPIT